MVGLGGLEPPASPLSGVRSNQLSYRPNFLRRLFGLLFVVFVCSFGHILLYVLSLTLFDSSIKSKILAKNPHFGFFIRLLVATLPLACKSCLEYFCIFFFTENKLCGHSDFLSTLLRR